MLFYVLFDNVHWMKVFAFGLSNPEAFTCKPSLPASAPGKSPH